MLTILVWCSYKGLMRLPSILYKIIHWSNTILTVRVHSLVWNEEQHWNLACSCVAGGTRQDTASKTCTSWTLPTCAHTYILPLYQAVGRRLLRRQVHMTTEARLERQGVLNEWQWPFMNIVFKFLWSWTTMSNGHFVTHGHKYHKLHMCQMAGVADVPVQNVPKSYTLITVEPCLKATSIY